MHPAQLVIYLLLLTVPTIMSARTGKHARDAAKAVTPNHGGSVADAVARSETQLTSLTTDVGIMFDSLTEVAGQVGTLATNFDSHVKNDPPCGCAHSE